MSLDEVDFEQLDENTGSIYWENEAFRRTIEKAISAALQDVISNRDMRNENVVSGTLIMGSTTDELRISHPTTDIPTGNVWGSGGHGLAQGRFPKDTLAVAIAQPTFARKGFTYFNENLYMALSKSYGNIPIFVYSPYDSALVIIQAGQDPREVK